MQIRPNEAFPIVYLLSDPSDTATYYVRSVMRNSVTGAILKIANKNFVNLVVDPSNSRRFSTKIQAPGDPGAQGTWIDITTSVYTDAGYTTKSINYMETIDRYLVQERWTVSWGGGGGFGDWSKSGLLEKIQEGFHDTVKRLPPPVTLVTDMSEILDGHEKIKGMIDSIEIPEVPKIDLEKHRELLLKEFRKEMKNMIEQLPNFDLSPVIEAIQNIQDHITFPEPMQPEDYKPHLQNIHASLEHIKGLLPDRKYTDFMNDLGSRVAGKTDKVMNPFMERAKNLI